MCWVDPVCVSGEDYSTQGNTTVFRSVLDVGSVWPLSRFHRVHLTPTHSRTRPRCSRTFIRLPTDCGGGTCSLIPCVKSWSKGTQCTMFLCTMPQMDVCFWRVTLSLRLEVCGASLSFWATFSSVFLLQKTLMILCCCTSPVGDHVGAFRSCRLLRFCRDQCKDENRRYGVINHISRGTLLHWFSMSAGCTNSELIVETLHTRVLLSLCVCQARFEIL